MYSGIWVDEQTRRILLSRGETIQQVELIFTSESSGNDEKYLNFNGKINSYSSRRVSAGASQRVRILCRP